MESHVGISFLELVDGSFASFVFQIDMHCLVTLLLIYSVADKAHMILHDVSSGFFSCPSTLLFSVARLLPRGIVFVVNTFASQFCSSCMPSPVSVSWNHTHKFDGVLCCECGLVSLSLGGFGIVFLGEDVPF